MKEPEDFFRAAFARLLAFPDQTPRCFSRRILCFASAFDQKKVGVLHIPIEFGATRPYSCIIPKKGAFGLADSLDNDYAMLCADRFPQRSEKRAVAGSVIEPREPERHEQLPQVYHSGGPVHLRVEAGAGEADNRKYPYGTFYMQAVMKRISLNPWR